MSTNSTTEMSLSSLFVTVLVELLVANLPVLRSLPANERVKLCSLRFTLLQDVC